MCANIQNSCWLSGSEDGEVRRYMKGSSDLDGLVVSAAGVPIRCVAADPKGKRVAVASEYVPLSNFGLHRYIKFLQ
jgi:hypothetical protein